MGCFFSQAGPDTPIRSGKICVIRNKHAASTDRCQSVPVFCAVRCSRRSHRLRGHHTFEVKSAFEPVPIRTKVTATGLSQGSEFRAFAPKPDRHPNPEFAKPKTSLEIVPRSLGSDLQ